MIPKIIHYFWFGDNEIPQKDQRNIATWRKYCPDYEIKLWNEKNYALPDVKYVQDAARMKKWGHVCDYARLDVLYRYGGIYFDTDVEVLKSFDELLCFKGFIGFENEKNVNTGQGIGAEAGNITVKGMMDAYRSRNFILEDGSCDLTPCPEINTLYLLEKGLIQNNTRQTIEEMEVFPTEYFCPKHILTGKITITKNSYSIHHFEGNWFDPEKKKKMRRSEKIRNILGMRFGNMVINSIIQAGAIKNRIVKNRGNKIR